MIGVEFVRDHASRLPWGDRAKAMRSALLARGVLMHTAGAWDQVLRFMAPLIIEDELLERGLDAFEDALESLETAPERPGPASHVPSPTEAVARPHLEVLPPEHPIPTPAVPAPGRNLKDEKAH